MEPKNINVWKENISKHVSVDRWLEAYSRYIDILEGNNVPVIFELNHLSTLVGVELGVLNRSIYGTESFYRTFEIPKSSGGMRKIDAPYPSLLGIQKWITQNILSSVRLSDYTHGFVKRRSIITNAKMHLGARCMLKMDIENFFPSISLKRVIAIFRFLGYSPSVSYFLSTLCCLNGQLPQGGGASPQISNIVTTPLDRRLGGLAKSYELIFTRYADDLAFSGNYIPIKFIEIVATVVKSEGFSINTKKTKLMRGGGRRIVTGISIGSGELKFPKASKRKLRQEIYWLEKKGILSQSEYGGNFDPMYVDRLLGKLNFWKSVETENQYVIEKIETIKKLIAIEM